MLELFYIKDLSAIFLFPFSIYLKVLFNDKFFFILFKPILFLILKRFFKKQMKAWIVSALEWLAIQTDNDIDDAIVKRVKSAMKLGVV